MDKKVEEKKDMKKLVAEVERKIRAAKKEQDRADWAGNYPEDHR